jgi:hypothetical protein
MKLETCERMKKFLEGNDIQDISKADFYNKAKGLLFGKTIEELQEMIKPGEREKLPVFVCFIIMAFTHDIKTGSCMNMETFIDHVFGKGKAADNEK